MEGSENDLPVISCCRSEGHPMLTSRCLGQPRQSWRSVSIRRTCLGLALAAVGVWKLMIADPAQAASFDCSKASTLVESLICADPTLSALDVEMAAAWGEARRASPNPNQLQEAQRAFIRQRGQCQNPRCIADIARQRTAELKTISASALAPGVGQPAAATPRPTPPVPQQGGGAFAGVVLSQPAAAGAPQTTRDGKIVQTVLAEGMGSTIESAVQNAAENALKQVVGTFVDTNTQIERRTQISEGLRSETRNIRRDMREYSQGSIQGFEVLENRMDGAIHRVTAKVAVRIDDFKVYVKKLTEGETAVGRGLFAQLATEEKNKESAADLVARHILEPALSGSIYRIKVLAPEKFDDPEGIFNIKVPLEYSIDPDYIQSAIKILEQIASQKIVQDRSKQTCPGPRDGMISGNLSGNLVIETSNIMGISQGPSGYIVSGSVTTYLLSGIIRELEKRHLLVPNRASVSPQFNLASTRGHLNMTVEILNQAGSPVHFHSFELSESAYTQSMQMIPIIKSANNFENEIENRRNLRGAVVAMQLNRPPTYLVSVPSSFSQRCANSIRLSVGKVVPGAAIFMKLPLDMIRQASNIVVKLQ
jgi:uncharacterized protein